MIGQDLAMTGNKQYADGENLNQNTSFNSPTLYVKDIYGNDVLTKKDYYTFIRSIEDLAYRNRYRFYRCDRGWSIEKAYSNYDVATGN